MSLNLPGATELKHQCSTHNIDKQTFNVDMRPYICGQFVWICLEYAITGPGNGLSSGDTKPLTEANVDIAFVAFNNNHMKAFLQAVSIISIARKNLLGYYNVFVSEYFKSAQLSELTNIKLTRAMLKWVHSLRIWWTREFTSINQRVQ